MCNSTINTHTIYIYIYAETIICTKNLLRPHIVPAALHHNLYCIGYEEPIKNTDKILKYDMKSGSFDQYREFCGESVELVLSAFFKEFVICPETYSCLEWVIDYHIFLKFFEILSKESL
jgi:hypothetical protein